MDIALQNNLKSKIDMYVDGLLSEKEIDMLWAELIQDEWYLDYLKSAANLKKVIERHAHSKEKEIA